MKTHARSLQLSVQQCVHRGEARITSRGQIGSAADCCPEDCLLGRTSCLKCYVRLLCHSSCWWEGSRMIVSSRRHELPQIYRRDSHTGIALQAHDQCGFYLCGKYDKIESGGGGGGVRRRMGQRAGEKFTRQLNWPHQHTCLTPIYRYQTYVALNIQVVT